MSEAERAKLLASHEEDMTRLEDAHNSEQQRSQDVLQVRADRCLKQCVLLSSICCFVTRSATLTHARFGLFQAKLEARRNKRRNAEKSKLEKDALLEDEETRRRQMLQSLQDESRRKAAAAAGDRSGGKA